MAEALKTPLFARDLLAVAHQDLRAARHLYTGQYYPQAVFYIQQSVEKGLKSYAVASGMINQEESRKEISHKTIKIFEKNTRELKQRALAEQERLKINPALLAAIESQVRFSDIIRSLDEVLEELKKLTHQDEQTLQLTEGDLKTAIKDLQDLHRDANHEKEKISEKSVTPSEFRRMKKDLLNFLDIALADQPDRLMVTREELNRNFTLESYEKMMKEILLQASSPMEVFQTFFQLSVILQPHAVARYPKTGFNPIKFYSADLPLVKSFTKLADITERVLNQVDAIYQSSGEVPHVSSL